MLVYISNSTEYHSRIIITYDTRKIMRVFINHTDDLQTIKQDLIQILAYNNITGLHKSDDLYELAAREIVPIFESKLAQRPASDEKTTIANELNTMLDAIDQSRLTVNANTVLGRLGGILSSQLTPPVQQHISFITKKNRLSTEVINMLADSVKKQIIAKKLTPPDFNVKAKYKQIKNFVHNLTKVWLSKDELLLFVHRMTQ